MQTESTPNADALKFLPGQQLTPEGGTYEFLTASSALPSPLATNLFGVEGVKSIFFGPDFIAVNKSPDASWALMKPEIYSLIIEHFTSGAPLFRERMAEEDDTTILDTDSEVVAMIKELLDTRVRPAIREDGGDLNYLGFDEGTGIVKLSLKGSCRGCASSAVTLKSGIERMLLVSFFHFMFYFGLLADDIFDTSMHYVPEVKEVQQVLGPEEEVALDEFAKLEVRFLYEKLCCDSADLRSFPI